MLDRSSRGDVASVFDEPRRTGHALLRNRMPLANAYSHACHFARSRQLDGRCNLGTSLQSRPVLRFGRAKLDLGPAAFPDQMCDSAMHKCLHMGRSVSAPTPPNYIRVHLTHSAPPYL